jgi:hypothetical protein
VPPVLIEDWRWEETDLEELANHGLSREIVLQVAYERPRFRRNKRGRAASHQMIGPDYGGRMWTICLMEVPGHPGQWRAITGWPADPEDQDWYGKW